MVGALFCLNNRLSLAYVDQPRPVQCSLSRHRERDGYVSCRSTAARCGCAAY